VKIDKATAPRTSTLRAMGKAAKMLRARHARMANA
jgi:hypothetical protein